MRISEQSIKDMKCKEMKSINIREKMNNLYAWMQYVMNAIF